MATVHQFPERRDESGPLFEPWLDEHKIAHHYDVSPRTVRRWMAAGCPTRKIAGQRRYRLSEVDGWLRTREQAAS